MREKNVPHTYRDTLYAVVIHTSLCIFLHLYP